MQVFRETVTFIHNRISCHLPKKIDKESCARMFIILFVISKTWKLHICSMKGIDKLIVHLKKNIMYSLKLIFTKNWYRRMVTD